MAERITPPAQPQQQGEIPKSERGTTARPTTARPKAEQSAPQAGDPAAPRRPMIITDWASI
jgi:hypothetical protein